MLWEAVENRKGAVKPRPLCTPLGLFFRSSWVVVCDTVLTFVCMLRYWMRNVVPRGLQWNCNEVLDVQCTSAEFCSPCGVQPGFRSLCGIYGRDSAIHTAYTAKVPQSMRHIQPEFRNLCGIYGGVSAIYAAYTAGVPQSMRYIRRGLRNLYYATIYPTEIYKVPLDAFRLSVELPVQKHTGTS